MTQQEITNLFANGKVKKGPFYKIMTQSIINGYKKITNLWGRFVNYYNKKTTKAKGTTPKQANPNVVVIIPNVMTTNTKTGNTLLAINPHQKRKVLNTYYDPNGNEITKDQYLQATGYKPSGSISDYYTKNINDVLKIGK